MLKETHALNVLIVDDEQEACLNLQNILRDYVDDQINVVGIAHNTREAEQLIKQKSPDAIFLDIEMPNENAFAFLERIMPFDFEVTFVTAYDEYAIKAFKLNAVDYILKPISIDELASAVSKLKTRMLVKSIISRENVSYANLSSHLHSKMPGSKITLKNGADVEIVEFKDIYFAEAQGSYTKIVFVKNNHVRDIILSYSLTEYEEIFPTDIFFRIHKTYLINCGHVSRILKDDTSQVIIANNYELPVSRRKFIPLLDFLKSNNYTHE
ncbi:MAG: LytTR family DNA-binding domain-containing protein [Bacteroidota bacterium]